MQIQRIKLRKVKIAKSFLMICIFCYILIYNVFMLGKGSKTKGSISCDEGYSVEGSSIIDCNVFAEWESEIPPCRCKYN